MTWCGSQVDGGPQTRETAGVGMAAAADKTKSLDAVMAQIEKQYGKGAVMRLGDDVASSDRRHPDRLDRARRRARHRRPAARPGRRDLRPGELGQDDASPCTPWPTPRRPAASRPSSTPSTRSTPTTPSKLGVDTDALLVSQPDTGEQALEIADMLIRSGRHRHHRHRLGGGPGAPRRDRGRDGRQPRRPPGPPDVPGPAQADRRDQQHRHHGDLHQPAPREDRRHVRHRPRRPPVARR